MNLLCYLQTFLKWWFLHFLDHQNYGWLDGDRPLKYLSNNSYFQYR